MNNIIRLATVFALVAPSVLAHHGPTNSPSLYHTDKLIFLEGEITRVLWRNPHVRMKMKVMNDNGEAEIWELETTVPSLLKRAGITPDIIKAGDPVKAAGYVSRRDPHSIGLQNLLLPDGREFTGRTRDLIWSTKRVARVEPSIEKSKAEAALQTASGLSRVWSRWPGAGGNSPEYDHLLTKAAQEGKAAFDPTTHPVLDCEARGMPEMMLTPAPMELVEEEDRIIMHSIWPGPNRVFHLNGNDASIKSEKTHLGYSTAVWEDDNTLVVNTSHVNWPYFDRAGTPQSDQVSYVERFTMDKDRTKLDYVVTATDPVMFTEPVELRYSWNWVPGEEVPPNDCIQWDDPDA